jgi:CheY-like chemotaxis protein
LSDHEDDSPTVELHDGTADVLVVEDDRDLRVALGSALREEGYRVAVAATGLGALMYLRSAPPPALILLDLVLPQCSGWDFCAEHGRDDVLRSIPIVAITALRNAQLPVEVRELMLKPLRLDALLEVVNRYCGPLRCDTEVRPPLPAAEERR